VLAVGAHLKNTVAISRGKDILISQHLGDLETPEAFAAFQSEITQMQALFDARPTAVVSDRHPDYLSSAYAHGRPETQIRIQHHVAHIAACMVENEIAPPFLGVAWDGTGLGTDGTIWGGEFFVVHENRFDRIAHLRQFPLPGGEAVAQEPRRSALGMLYVLEGRAALTREEIIPVHAFTNNERTTLLRMLERNLNSPLTSSMGRLFDAVSALVGVRQHNGFEGQAAMELEWIADETGTDCYPIALRSSGSPAILDWAPMIHAILDDLRKGVSPATISGRFHRCLADAILRVARHAGFERVAISGGCFQNVLLTRSVLQTLDAAGFRVYRHQRIPPNDGCIAPGQIAAASYMGLFQ
jgi:hydrogenase maturation protein HypF